MIRTTLANSEFLQAFIPPPPSDLRVAEGTAVLEEEQVVVPKLVQRLSFTAIGTPARICGRGSEVTLATADSGSTYIAARVTTVPRSKGPAWAGTLTTRL